MKMEWRKEEPQYRAKTAPQRITVPRRRFLTIRGEGDPNKEDFQARVGVLYALSYAMKAQYKAYCATLDTPPRYTDYTVFPLEGLWTSSGTDPTDKDSFRYTIMIQQPGFAPAQLFGAARQATAKKKPHPLLEEVRLEEVEDGSCVQVLHYGTFDSEPASFAKMEAFCREHGLCRQGGCHREIYLTNALRTAPEKRKTILRYPVAAQGERGER